jgi:Fic family protein
VAGYRGAPSEECEYLLERLCDWLNNEEFKQKDSLIAFGILRAILAHIYLAWIHPFGDGNGRTARLIEFKILLAHGVPSPAAHLLSNHYNQTRSEYYRQLDYSSKAKGDVIPFIEYAVQGFIDGLKEQLKVVQGQQMRIMWRDFIYENFRNKSGASFDRKRKLILDIADNLAIIPFKQIRHISPRIAELYANKTDKAIRRDINVLIEMDLLKREPKGYRARWEKLRAFLPERMVE